jgi:SecD/SecF fusion protein
MHSWSFETNSKGFVKLASPEIFANRSLQGEDGVDWQMTDSQKYKKSLREKLMNL